MPLKAVFKQGNEHFGLYWFEIFLALDTQVSNFACGFISYISLFFILT